MISEQKLFENIFDDIKIINSRLYNFGIDTLGRLTAANGGGDYTTLIALIKPPLLALADDLGLVDTSLTIQIGATLTNDQVMAAFKLTMSEKEGAIADKLGGRTTPAYLQFYPHKISEYTNATKTQMPVLTHRVNVAATANSVALGAMLTALLQGYETSWTTSRTDQETQMGTVEDMRNQRDDVRINVELALLTTVHTIAAKFPGDVPNCSQFFDFKKLFSIAHHTHDTKSGVIPANGKVVVANLSWSDLMALDIKNTDDNSEFVAYIALNATDEPGPLAKKVKAKRGIRPKPSQLGDLSGTFLILKSLSSVNDGSYYVDIKS
jgi:hypothetical protein